MTCPLCEAKKETEWFYEDDMVWCAYCKSHPDKVLIVLKRHTSLPMPQEEAHMSVVAHNRFRGKKFRGPRSIKDHYHMHEV